MNFDYSDLLQGQSTDEHAEVTVSSCKAVPLNRVHDHTSHTTETASNSLPLNASEIGTWQAVIQPAAAEELPALTDRLVDTLTAPHGPPATVQDILFVDAAVRYDFQVYMEHSSVEVVLLDAQRDGVRQITDHLAACTPISAIHIVSHGAPGQVALGTGVLNSETLDTYTDALRNWGTALTQEGDILFYGCDVARGPIGSNFVDCIAELTNADVAASTDKTGTADLGGNWILEYSTGPIEATLASDTSGFPSLLDLTITSIAAVAHSGIPTDVSSPSANVRQPITINGTDFDLSTQAIFPTIESTNASTGTVNVNPTYVTPDGTSMEVVVPDTAMTGDVGLVGGTGSIFYQLVPTLVDIDLGSSSFAEGSGFTVLGSGFTEGDIRIRFGATEVVDTHLTEGPDVYNNLYIGAGLNRSDNDAISLAVPASAPTGPITVATAGGTSAALPISLTELVGAALEGTATNAGQASVNPGQTIEVRGGGFDLTTEVVFPTIDEYGSLSNRAVAPDFVSVNGTLMEVRVPDSAITGNIRVIGAAGTFPLQIVPTLELAEPFTSGSAIRLLGAGFTEDSGLSVDFGGVTIGDTGSNIDVLDEFLENDMLRITSIPDGGVSPISVTTAGGTSPSIDIANDDPADVTDIYSMAIFPGTAGDDAGRFVVVDSAIRNLLGTTT